MNTNIYTLCGILTILIWCSNNYLFRQLTNNFGTFLGSGLSYILGGMIGYIIYYFTQTEFTQINKTTCFVSSLFVINMIFCALAFSLPPTGDVLLQCTIINYFWTILSNIFLVLFLNYKIRFKFGFYFGVILSIVGIVVACVGFNLNQINFIKYFPKYYYCYIFAVISAVSWAYYTTYLKKYTSMVKNDHVFVLLIITGIICVLLSLCFEPIGTYNQIKFGLKEIGVFLYESIIVFCFSYYFWSVSSKNGDIKTLMNFSLLAPVLNIIFTSIFYNISLLGNVIYGSIILVIAVICCKYSMCDKIDEIDDLNNSNKIEQQNNDVESNINL